MDADFHRAMAEHFALIRKVHERELQKIQEALLAPPQDCPHCGKSVGRACDNDDSPINTEIRLVHSRD